MNAFFSHLTSDQETINPYENLLKWANKFTRNTSKQISNDEIIDFQDFLQINVTFNWVS